MAQAVTNERATGGSPNPVDQTGLCLLSLDGGGVRGLSTLYILKRLMTQLNHERQKIGTPALKPCELFDLIGGTSTGGLIAIMLGRLEMDVDKCITAYNRLIKVVFEEQVHRIPFNLSGDIRPRFDSGKFKKAFEEVIIGQGYSPAAPFNDGKAHGCKVFVCTATKDPYGTTRLRNYDLPRKSRVPATISEAALATSAATGFFDPVSIGARKFVDAALGVNNPAEEMETEASDIWCADSGAVQPLVKCFVSIGTGNPGKKAIEDELLKFLTKTLIQIARETEETAKRFVARWRQHYDQSKYFRLNVEQGLQDVGLAEYKEQGRIETATDQYLDEQQQIFQMRDCVENLKAKQKRAEATLESQVDEYNKSRVPGARRSDDEIAFLKCLNKTDYAAIKKTIPEWTDGTCRWILDHSTYKRWLGERSSSILWIPGDPGCGKSVLASFLVHHLQSPESQEGLHGDVCYFFFKDGAVSQQGALAAMSALLYQLLTSTDNGNILSDVVRDVHDGGKTPEDATGTAESLWDILMKAGVKQRSGSFIFVVDGLDECENWKVFIDCLSSHFGKHSKKDKPYLKFIITGRPYTFLETRFGGMQTLTLNLETESQAICSDLELVARAEVDRLASIWELSQALQTKIVERLIKLADRSFLWIRVVFGDIRARADTGDFNGMENEFDEILSSGDLDETYEKLLARASNRYPGLARTILGIVLVAKRPLTVGEMITAISIMTGSQSSHHLKHPLPKPELSIKNICGLLVRIIDSKIYLIHQTARTFLVETRNLDGQKPTDQTWKHSIDIFSHEGDLAERCMTYLLRCCRESQLVLVSNETQQADLEAIIQECIRRHDFLGYASKYWTYHFNWSVSRNYDTVITLVNLARQLIDTQSKQFLTWFQISWTGESRSGLCPQDFTPLMAATFFGLWTLVRKIVDEGGDIEATGSRGQTALDMALNGFVSHGVKPRIMAKQLLDLGAQFHSPPQKGTVKLLDHKGKFGEVSRDKDGEEFAFLFDRVGWDHTMSIGDRVLFHAVSDGTGNGGIILALHRAGDCADN
ncbi:hypothetical protein LTR99_006370 [Exophiala xenobiotica]|uniref:PNPLA domain-containing protein n=1 Tax=Vermiconidia calcicola TaxID=1690605 RepID=A0AAV9QAE8_9PEZI|nr:hypothetical protein LTR99_006370 [Exophiala xenobiotica]KAK5430501.1 hypothetical protein LTR34_006228 [Exophiala xenobiotica]KAK5537541.1 hypothetical protein LTR25_004793 [Vermiconidia calcicola]